jgi:hypothetical protein
MKKIKDILNDVGVPVSLLTYEGKEDTYITFFCINDYTVESADDVEKLKACDYQIDIWSKGNFNKLAKEVEKRMLENGFRKINYFELYEKDTKIYHKVMRFYYMEEN